MVCPQVTRPGSLMLLLAAEIVVIAALGSGTKHDPLPGANGMVDFLQADAQSVILREPQSSHDFGNPSCVHICDNRTSPDDVFFTGCH